MPAGPGEAWWTCRATDGAGGAPVWTALVRSPAHPDGTRVVVAAADGDVPVGAVCVAHHGREGRVVRLALTPRLAEKAPPLWFVEIRESAATPPAVNLVAFTGAGVAAGSLLDTSAGQEVGARTSDQVGAVRWYPATGEVDQIFVAPRWRRQAAGTALVMAAATLAHGRDWPRFWGDGQRTRDGEAWRNAGPWRERMAALTHVAPSMDLPRG